MGKDRKKIDPITREDVEMAILDGAAAPPSGQVPPGVTPASDEDLAKLRAAVIAGKIDFSKMHMLDHRWWECRKAAFAYGGIHRHILMILKYQKGWDWIPDRTLRKTTGARVADIGGSDE